MTSHPDPHPALSGLHAGPTLAADARSRLRRARLDAAPGLSLRLLGPLHPRAPGLATQAWQEDLRRLARVDHPGLGRAEPLVGPDGRVDLLLPDDGGPSLAERLAAGPAPGPAEWVGWMVGVLEALAALHDAGLVHGALAAHAVMLAPEGGVRLVGAGVAGRGGLPAEPTLARQLELLQAALLLHRGLAGAWAFDEPDLGRAARRIGPELLRLGWALPRPVPQALRAIVNRALDRDPAHRPLHARSLARSLQSWLDAQRQGEGGLLPVLQERLQAHILVARPGLGRRLAALERAEGPKLEAWVDLALGDPGLACELLRQLGAASLSSHVQHDEAPTLRRALQLRGLNGLRQAVQALKPWPGPLDGEAAAALEAALRRAGRGARLARAICPADHDAEAAAVLALLMQLGPLLLRQHFPDEAAQIDTLVQPQGGTGRSPPLRPDEAAQAVLGLEPGTMADAAMRAWGLDEAVRHAARPLPEHLPVRAPHTRLETLRTAASAALELLAGHPPSLVQQRHQQALGLARGELAAALAAHPEEACEAPRAAPGPDAWGPARRAGA